MSKITSVEIRMYKIGTGDCFALKFFSGTKKEPSFKMLIDAGAWKGTTEVVSGYISDLKNYLNDYVNVLVVTHEHKDHVHAFDACEELFTDGKFKAGEVWMAWTENDKVKKVKEWKKDYGEKKKALGLVADKLDKVLQSEEYKKQFAGNKFADKALSARKTFSDSLRGFADLHLSASGGEYKGGLKGMDVVKTQIIKENGIKYFNPGDVIEDLEGMEGVKIYVLGPPKLYEDIKKETGGEGESYKHHEKLGEIDAFAAAISNPLTDDCPSAILPFEDSFIDTPKSLEAIYNQNEWQKIDNDWMFSSGSLALRMMGLTNNLSLVLAFEFDDQKVILFPGDAEYGSWASWHKIKWPHQKKGENEKHFTEDLLNRTVFYKVAHHLSHNGTAKSKGVEMMNHRDLVAMATLDYNVISEGWTGTMPNKAIVKELLSRTKGRLMIMNEKDIFYDHPINEIPISDKVMEARTKMTTKEKKAFKDNLKETDLYIQYRVEV